MPVPTAALGGLCPQCLAAGLASSADEAQSDSVASLVESEVLGIGGMGVVHAARDEYLGREVAVKRLRPEREAQRGARERFVAEAQIASQLEHPGIVPVYQAGIDEQGRPFYAMRRVKGVSLAEVLHKLSEEDPDTVARYPLGTLLNVFQKVCDAVAYAHSRGVIHRDLKPENIMLGEFGEVLVMDWGLAKLLEERTAANDQAHTGSSVPIEQAPGEITANTTQTLDHTIVGTPGFMAPELAEGRSRHADERSDIYALGAILYNILTLRPSIRGTDANLMLERARSGDIRPPTDFNRGSGEIVAGRISLPHCPNRRIPAALSAVAMKALANEPEARYPEVTALQADVSAWQNGRATSAEQAGVWRETALWVQRHKVAVGIGALILLLVAAATWQVTRSISELRRTAPAFYGLARQAVETQDLDDALRQISYALTLAPTDPEFLNLKGNIMQSRLQLREARDLYARALLLQPSHGPAAVNLKLCDELLASGSGPDAWTPAELERLRSALAAQGRHAEALTFVKRVRATDSAFIEVWNEKLTAAGLRGRVVRKLDGSLELDLSTNRISNLAILAGIPLNHLKLNYTSVSNLAPLRGMPLASLEVIQTRIRELNGVTSLPLERLHCGHNSISDLTPLAGTRLHQLDVSFTKVADLSPLKGLPLETLSLQGTPVRDLTPLRGMALRSLNLMWTEVSDLSALDGMPLQDLHIWSSPVADLGPLARAGHLHWLDATETRVSDLTPLRNSPLQNLHLNATRVEDLRPLRTVQKLFRLHLGQTRVKDLSPLQGLRPRELGLHNTEVTDIGPLRGMPLKMLRLDGCVKLKNVAPLLDCSDLEQLTLPAGATNIAVLRQLPRLKRLGYHLKAWDKWSEVSTPDEFWRNFDAAQRKR